MSKDIDKSRGKNGGNTALTGTKSPEFEEKKWRPGESGNPKGRPVGRKTGLRARLLQELDKQADPDIVDLLKKKGISLDNGDCAEVIAKVLTRKSQKGDVQASRLIADQTEEPLPKQIQLEAKVEVTKIERLILDAPNSPKDR